MQLWANRNGFDVSLLVINQPRSRRKIAFLFLLTTLASGSPAGAAKKREAKIPRALGLRIDSILSQSSAHRGFWGIEVLRLRDGKILFKRNQDHVFTPASNMKLFTTAAAIEKLSPDFVIRTTVETPAPPDAQGRVSEISLVGRGDANLSGRVLPYHLKTDRKEPADAVFRELADQVAARGVREVQGDLVADDSYFLFEPYGHDWAEEDLEWGYGAPVTALAFNDNQLIFHVHPAGAIGEKASVSLGPINDYYQINNRLETISADGREHISVERAPGSKQLDVWGQVPLGASIEDDAVSIESPPQLIGEIFLKLLEARGIKVDGRVTVKHFTPIESAAMANAVFAPVPPVVLAEHHSAALREDIKVINKVSQNLHAEMLLRTLGQEVKNFGGLATGLEVLRSFVAKVGIPPDEFYFVDGSGLSRQTLVAPDAVVRLLQYMAKSPRFQVFYDSLPVSGIDGTLAQRFIGSSAVGSIHAKTGTISHVNALSGYMDLPYGERLAFAIYGNLNALDARDGARTVDEIALAIYEKFAGRRKAGTNKLHAPESSRAKK
jgi:D-alanyl-D-alanine carboxypeptidase/D-alanyl-D-alanine-endopeptidase (penicillin-binding protein 4)